MHTIIGDLQFNPIKINFIFISIYLELNNISKAKKKENDKFQVIHTGSYCRKLIIIISFYIYY